MGVTSTASTLVAGTLSGVLSALEELRSEPQPVVVSAIIANAGIKCVSFIIFVYMMIIEL